MGFIFEKDTYLRSSWNILDFTIVLSGILSKIPFFSKYSFMVVLRTLRVLRPLKAASKWNSMRILLKSIMASIPGILNASAFIVFIL